jgi:hypothetical protein
MAGQTITIKLPDDLYERLLRRATEAQRSLGDEVVEMLRASNPEAADGLPKGLEAELARLETLDDASLLKRARQRVPLRKTRRLEALNFKQQQQGLNRAERRVAVKLAEEFDRRMLLRSKVLLLLKQRGYDMDAFLFGR